jgi:hypothetical protein
MPQAESTTAQEAALAALRKGFAPVPIPSKSKNPGFAGWQDYSTTEDEVPEAFEGNLGLLLGEPSEGLVDIDLDCPEAEALADLYLPKTPMVHGRKSHPRSHRWYVVDPVPKTVRFQDPRRDANGKQPTIIEIRSTGGQTVIPPSVHPSGETLRWERGQWAKPKTLPRTTLVQSVAQLAACSLLARHWPGEGARHDVALALAGGLLRNGWDVDEAATFICSAASIGGDDEAEDRRLDVLSTARRLEDGGETVGWPTLVELLTEPVVKRLKKWLMLEDDDDGSEGMRNKRLVGEAIRKGVPEPEWVIPGILYAGHVTWMQGEPGDGKTLLALRWLLDTVNAGRNVMLIDEESGLRMTAERLAMMGADPDLLDARLHYYERPGLTTHEDDVLSLVQEARTLRPDLVVLDSAADSITQSGISEDSSTEVTGWYKTLIAPLAFDYGAAVLVIDHVPKPGKDSVKGYARGSGAKKAKTDAAWKVEKVSDFGIDPPTIGLVELRRDKDRLGRLPSRINFRIGVTRQGKTIVEQQDKSVVVERSPEEDLKGRLIEWLQDNAATEAEAKSTKEVRAGVTGKASTIIRALAELADEYGSPVDFYKDGETKKWWAHREIILEVDFTE